MNVATIKKPLSVHLTILKQYINQLIANEISLVTRYCRKTIQIFPTPHDSGVILSELQCREKIKIDSFADVPDFSNGDTKEPVAFLLNGSLNHDLDIQRTLTTIKSKCSRQVRVVAVLYNSYHRYLYLLSNFLNVRQGEMPSTFLTFTDVDNIAKISGFEVTSTRNAVYCPFQLFGLGSLINYIMPAIPLLNRIGLVSVITFRPIIAESSRPSLSIVIPARNEAGNIENALKRMPKFNGAQLEIIFVEGHSTDNTWSEIQRVQSIYSGQFKIQSLQQKGKGKVDAVRLGFSVAQNELLTILDADLTMPPEKLERFYDAYCAGLADFVNGSRLVYPMEGEAMQFLNKLGNVFFAKTLSYLLSVRLGDSLCGTKMMTKVDYERMTEWRADFGDFDPFGDFELIFPAATMGLGITDIPIRYLARTYGSTNINRFRHGLILLKMTLIGIFKIKTGRLSS